MWFKGAYGIQILSIRQIVVLFSSGGLSEDTTQSLVGHLAGTFASHLVPSTVPWAFHYNKVVLRTLKNPLHPGPSSGSFLIWILGHHPPAAATG